MLFSSLWYVDCVKDVSSFPCAVSFSLLCLSYMPGLKHFALVYKLLHCLYSCHFNCSSEINFWNTTIMLYLPPNNTRYTCKCHIKMCFIGWKYLNGSNWNLVYAMQLFKYENMCEIWNICISTTSFFAFIVLSRPHSVCWLFTELLKLFNLLHSVLA